MDLKDIHRTFHQIAEYTLSSSTHRTFSRTNHMLYHKTILLNLRLNSYQVSFLTTVKWLEQPLVNEEIKKVIIKSRTVNEKNDLTKITLCSKYALWWY